MNRIAASFIQKLRAYAGCWLNERWRLEIALNPYLSALIGIGWQDLCNRNEMLGIGDDEVSRICAWQWSSALTVCRIFPKTGLRLLYRCLLDWPIKYGLPPTKISITPRLSVILPVGGKERFESFKCVLASIWGQDIREIECVVVEHSERPEYRAYCDDKTVRYIHVGKNNNEPFNKSRAMNIGVGIAKAPVVLLHDADIIIPFRYTRSILSRLDAGWDALQPIRFLFYLGRNAISPLEDGKIALCKGDIESVGQNYPGGSTAVRKDVYFEMDGHNEKFQGWGGEDNEFLERLKKQKMFSGGYTPALHLLHPPSDKKFDSKSAGFS